VEEEVLTLLPELVWLVAVMPGVEAELRQLLQAN
jgi:hypothetical protein